MGQAALALPTLRKKRLSNSVGNLQHGQAKRGRQTATYNSWRGMWRRCTSLNATGYSEYGGRGITVCEEWQSFEKFYADMGERPKGTTLDREKNDDNYEPGNCRWATPKEQANNRRTNRVFEFEGVNMTLKQISEKSGIGIQTLIDRLRRGVEISEAATVKPKEKPKVEYRGVTMTLTELSRICGVKICTLWYRVKNGWSVEEAVAVKPNHSNRREKCLK